MGKAAQKRAEAEAKTLHDIDVYMLEIQKVIKRYSNIVERLDAIKDDRNKDQQKKDFVDERHAVKEQFIQKKQACRALFALLSAGNSMLKEGELKSLQEEFRDVDADFKALQVRVDRDFLLADAPVDESASHDVSTNKGLLDAAIATEKATTTKLQSGLITVVTSQAVAKGTLQTISEDREKIDRIGKGLDEVDSELTVSKSLLLRFIKRLYTDKAIIAFATLLVLGLVGIIIYATVDPNQKIFNVPDAIKPPISSNSSSSR